MVYRNRVVSYRRPRAVPQTRVGAARVLQAAWRAIRLARRAKSGVGAWSKRVRQYEGSRAKKRQRMSVPRRMYTVGTYRGKFKKPVKKKFSNFRKACVSRSSETGGVSTDVDCVYIGHSVAFRQVLSAVCSAIIKKLFEKSGHIINSMEQKYQGEILVPHSAATEILRIQRRITQEGAVDTRDLVFVADSTYQDISDQLLNELVITGTTQTFEILQFQLLVNTVMEASLSGTDMNIVLSYYSALNVQNQTVGTNLVDDQTTDVTNNPLEGKCYSGKGTGYTPKLWNVTTALTAENNFVADAVTGLIEFNVNGANVPQGMKDILKRPANRGALSGVSKMSNVRLGPGMIKRGVVKGVEKTSLNKFLKIWLDSLRASGTGENLRVWYGKSEMFAFEKLCRTGVGAQSIIVGYEINQLYRCCVYETKIPCATTHVVV